MKNVPLPISQLREKARILNRPAIRRILARNPDAEWDLYLPRWGGESPRLYGRISLEYVRDCDIRDLCNGADSDSWTLSKDLIDREVSGVRVQLTLNAWQRYTADEVETLRGIGKLVDVSQPSTYRTLVCSR